MPYLRAPLLALALLLAAPLTAAAQTTIIAGQTPLYFDHDGLDTTGFELCVDTLTACTPITATRMGTTNVWTFIAPATLVRGDRVLRVRAVGPGGTSDPSDVVTFRAVVKPGKPGVVRTTQ